jgi:ketosteroid isomerase-like protein
VDDADVPTLDSILRSDAFALGPYAGSSRTRKQVLEGWASTAKERAKLGSTQTHTIAEHAIRAAGDMAVSTGRFLMTTTAKDGESKYSGQFVHVWGRDKTGWKLVADYTFPFGRLPRPAATPPSEAADVLSAYAGTYRLEQDVAVIAVKVDGASLVAQWQAPGQDPWAMPLTAATQTTFLGPNQMELVFVRTAGGEVRELLILGDGPATRAIRQQGAP